MSQRSRCAVGSAILLRKDRQMGLCFQVPTASCPAIPAFPVSFFRHCFLNACLSLFRERESHLSEVRREGDHLNFARIEQIKVFSYLLNFGLSAFCQKARILAQR